MRYKVTFIRHGAPGELTFNCREDAEMFAEWLEPAGVGLHSEISEVEGDVPLTLTRNGPGSRADIVAYVQEVLDQRTAPHDDTTTEKLARGIVTSILSRLGAGYSVAAGGAPETPAPPPEETT